MAQLGAWLAIFLAGYTLALWPSQGRSITSALTEAGSSIFTLGFAEPPGTGPAVVVFIAAATGMVVVALQIGYLPTLYAAFNRRETDVALLASRAGVPSFGPELLARQYYALGSGVSTLDTLPELYQQWERWAADVAESHTTYLPLVRFRSPLPYSSWVISLLAMLDSAALILVLAPEQAPTVAARLFLRSGFTCLTRVARAMGMDVPVEADPNGRDLPDLRGVPRRHQPGCSRSSSRWPAMRRTPGRTSSAGGSTTRARPTRSPRRSTRSPRPGRARAATP